MDIGILKITNNIFDSKLFDLVSKTRKKKANSYTNRLNIKLSLFSELLLKVMVKKYTDDWKNLKLIEDNNGKPRFQTLSNINFSLSHSDNIIICSVDKNNEQGIDIEKISNIPYEIFDLTLHKNEQTFLSNIKSNTKKSEEFFKIWTAKEAFSKYTGNGLGENFTKIDTTSSKFKINILQWKEEKYMCTLYATNIKDVNILNFNEERILKYYD